MISFQKIIGDAAAHKENALVAFTMLLCTLCYAFISAYVIPDYRINWFEFIGTWSGLVTVWLSRTRNILCWPWGILSAALFGYFFMQIGLPGQQWLNWGYFLVIQLWAWPYWVFGGASRTELPVTTLTPAGRCLALGSVLLGTVLVYLAIDFVAPGSQSPVLDALVVSASVVAQFLLGKKKVESWILWLGPVNLVSIVLFIHSGAYMASALYVAFFIHAIFALRTWHAVVIKSHTN